MLENFAGGDCPVCWSICPSPIHLDNWTEFLFSHPDHQFDQQGPTLHSAFRDHPSASANAHAVRDHIQTEVEAGQLVGPVDRSLLLLAPQIRGLTVIG